MQYPAKHSRRRGPTVAQYAGKHVSSPSPTPRRRPPFVLDGTQAASRLIAKIRSPHGAPRLLRAGSPEARAFVETIQRRNQADAAKAAAAGGASEPAGDSPR